MFIAGLYGTNATFVKEKKSPTGDNGHHLLSPRALYKRQLIYSLNGRYCVNELDVILSTLQKRKDVSKG